MTMVKDAHKGTEDWINADGPFSVPIRRSLMAWVKSQQGGEAAQISAIYAMLDLAKHAAQSHPQYRDQLAEAFYRAADDVGTRP